MKLYIKNMASNLCKIVVKEELNRHDLTYIFVELGEVEIMETLDNIQLNLLKEGLQKYGFELMEDRKSILVERIKTLIIEMIHITEGMPKIKISEFISQKLDHDYTYLANLFSEVKGTTIEQFIIAHKIEKVKELLIYNELTLTQIADQLSYSSVAHLSNQFKKVSGLSPSHFKQLKEKRRNSLDDVENNLTLSAKK